MTVQVRSEQDAGQQIAVTKTWTITGIDTETKTKIEQYRTRRNITNAKAVAELVQLGLQLVDGDKNDKRHDN